MAHFRELPEDEGVITCMYVFMHSLHFIVLCARNGL